MFLVLRLCYISLIIYCLYSIEGLINNRDAWFRNEVSFSDWRNIKKVDYSSNAVVANWYSGGHSQYFRNEQLKDVMGKLDKGDTLTIGLDYYYLWPGSPHFDTGINTPRLQNDEVITVKVWKLNNSITCKEYVD